MTHVAAVRPDGLSLVTNILTCEEEKAILTHLRVDPGHAVAQIHPANEYGWRFLKRGAKASYPGGLRPLTILDRLKELPDWLSHVWSLCVPHIHHTDALEQGPDHAIVNSYPVGDGCVAHVDDIKFWTSWVVGVSLGSGCEIHFRPLGTPVHGCDPYRMYVPPRSMYILTGAARYLFTHAIPFDDRDGEMLREHRTSITFRAISPAFLSDALRAQIMSL